MSEEKKVNLVVTSKVKAFVKKMSAESGVPSISKEALGVLSDKVEMLLEMAVQKAKEGKRKTIKGRDLE